MFRLLIGGTYRVNGTAEKATAKNNSIIFFFNSFFFVNKVNDNISSERKQKLDFDSFTSFFFFWFGSCDELTKKNKRSEWMNIYTNIGENKMMKSPFRFGCAVFVWLHSNYVRIRRFLITFGSMICILLHISAWALHWFHMDPIHSEWRISIKRVLFLVSVSMFSIFPLHYEVTEVWHVKRGPLKQPIPISKHAF